VTAIKRSGVDGRFYGERARGEFVEVAIDHDQHAVTAVCAACPWQAGAAPRSGTVVLQAAGGPLLGVCCDCG
jgi:hypothetical protein